VLDVTLTSGDSVLLQATGASSYAWSPPEGLSCTNCANPIATPLVTTNYTVTGIDSLQCKSSALIKIQVEEPCGEVFFPTVFSPDNKGPDKNETLCAYGNCITELTYEIFNRWGQRVFRSNSLNDCWDGKINGVPAEPGAFVYRATYTLRDKNSKEVYGTLILSK
jgi:gliding motility-associated-like protein